MIFTLLPLELFGSIAIPLVVYIATQALVRGHDEGGAGKGADWSHLAGIAEHFSGKGDAAGGYGTWRLKSIFWCLFPLGK